MKTTIKILWLLAYSLLLIAYSYGQEDNHIFIKRGSTTTLKWQALGDFTSYDSVYFAVKPCISLNCGRLMGVSKKCAISYSDPYTTITCTLNSANTAGLNAAKYYYSIYAYGPDSVWITDGDFNLRLRGQSIVDGIASMSPVYILAVDSSDQEPGILVNRNSTNSLDWWSIDMLADTLGVISGTGTNLEPELVVTPAQSKIVMDVDSVGVRGDLSLSSDKKFYIGNKGASIWESARSTYFYGASYPANLFLGFSGKSMITISDPLTGGDVGLRFTAGVNHNGWTIYSVGQTEDFVPSANYRNSIGSASKKVKNIYSDNIIADTSFTINGILEAKGVVTFGNPSNQSYTFPSVDGSVGTVLKTDGNGNLYFGSDLVGGGGGGGSDTATVLYHLSKYVPADSFVTYAEGLTRYKANGTYLIPSDSTAQRTYSNSRYATQKMIADSNFVLTSETSAWDKNSSNDLVGSDTTSKIQTQYQSRNYITDGNTNWNNFYGYITGNQSISLSGDASGTGTTAITVVVANDSHTHNGTTLVDSTVFTSEIAGKLNKVDSTTGYLTPTDAHTTYLGIHDSTIYLTPADNNVLLSAKLNRSDSTVYLTPADNNVLLAAKLNRSDSTIYLTPADGNVAYETKDAAITKTDEVETISANWVNTAYPWAENEVASTLATETEVKGFIHDSLSVADTSIHTMAEIDSAVARALRGAYQSLDADLTDLADGSLTFTKVAGLQDSIDALQNTDALKAPLADPTFTGAITHAGIKIQTHSITTDSTLATALCYGGVFYVPEAQTITLPAIAVGMSVTFITTAGVAVTIDVNGSDDMMLDGVDKANGVAATNTSTAGDIIVFTYMSANHWYAASGSNDGDLWTTP